MKRKLNILCVLLFVIVAATAQTPQPNCEEVCDNISIYGDANDNIPTQIKHYGGTTYLAATVTVGGQLFATLTKLDEDDEVIWEHQFSMPSRVADFVKTDNGLLLIGRTEPAASGNAFLARIDADGNEIFIRTYQSTARSLFLRIVEHSNPLNLDFPFYVTAFENNTNAPSVFDNSQLYNIDNQGNINWIAEYEFGQMDEQIGVAIAPLANGNLFIAGNGVDNEKGMIIKVNGLNGQAFQPVEAAISGIYNYAAELSNGNIITSNFLTHESGETVVSLFDNNLNLLSSLRLNNIYSAFIAAAGTDNADNFYVVGRQNSGQPVLCKLTTANNTLTLVASKYFNNGETSFDGYALHVDDNKIYYADGRTEHPLSNGGSDILLGYFDTDLTDNCLVDASISTSIENHNLSPLSIASSNVNTPNIVENISLLPQSYNIAPLCEPTTTDSEEVTASQQSELTLFPNPAHTQVYIGYELPATAHVSITLFDIQSRKIDEMVNATQTAGRQNYVWNVSQKGLPGGVYFIQLQIDGQIAGTEKLVVN